MEEEIPQDAHYRLGSDFCLLYIIIAGILRGPSTVYLAGAQKYCGGLLFPLPTNTRLRGECGSGMTVHCISCGLQNCTHYSLLCATFLPTSSWPVVFSSRLKDLCCLEGCKEVEKLTGFHGRQELLLLLSLRKPVV